MTATQTASSSPMDAQQYQDVMGYLPTGVAAIVTRVESELAGMVVGSFSFVSLEPPLVSITVGSRSGNWARVRKAGHFTASVLSSDQRGVSHLLSGQSPDKFTSVPLLAREDGCVVIDGCVAWVQCEIEQEIQAGDHTIVLAKPTRMGIVRGNTQPMVFYRRSYHRMLQVEDLVGPAWI